MIAGPITQTSWDRQQTSPTAPYYDPYDLMWGSGNNVYQFHAVVCVPPPSKLEIELLRFAKQFDAIQQSRAISIAPIPERQPPVVRRAYRHPLAHHLQRCQDRRPRLSLRARIE